MKILYTFQICEILEKKFNKKTVLKMDEIKHVQNL